LIIQPEALKRIRAGSRFLLYRAKNLEWMPCVEESQDPFTRLINFGMQFKHMHDRARIQFNPVEIECPAKEAVNNSAIALFV
jgi:hypothetical protein